VSVATTWAVAQATRHDGTDGSGLLSDCPLDLGTSVSVSLPSLNDTRSGVVAQQELPSVLLS